MSEISTLIEYIVQVDHHDHLDKFSKFGDKFFYKPKEHSIHLMYAYG